MGSRISLFMMGKALAAPAPNQPAGIPVVVFIVSIIVILMIAAFAAYFLANYFSRSMNEKFIKELQYELTKNTYDERRYSIGERPGEYKKHDYVTGREEVGALPEDVPEEIGELLSDLAETNLDSPKHILTAAAYFHAKFENIHPFADGNGRTGRLATNYFLMNHNHPPLIIHEEDRNDYYAALESWDTKQELAPLKEFLTSQIEKTWQRQIQRMSRNNKGEI